jgi:hypothetical protein
MRFFVFLILAVYNIYGANLLTYNIYERSDRVDVMLSFDSPYEGKIFQKRGENFTLLTLNDLSYDKLIEKNINSKILQAFSIAPDKDSIKVTLKSDKNIAVIASKTVDGFGLRIRAKPIFLQTQKAATKTVQNATSAKTPLKSIINSNNEELIDSRYISVIGVLFIFLLFMLWLKYRLKKRMNTPSKNKKSWLFTPNSGSKETDVSFLYKKPIDQNNSVILLEFRGKQYLIISGNSNVLLEKFGDNDIENNSDFEKAFEENRRKLDDYLKLQDSGIDSYKSKASGEFNSQFESY